jgi:hypothetical protein
MTLCRCTKYFAWNKSHCLQTDSCTAMYCYSVTIDCSVTRQLQPSRFFYPPPPPPQHSRIMVGTKFFCFTKHPKYAFKGAHHLKWFMVLNNGSDNYYGIITGSYLRFCDFCDQVTKFSHFNIAAQFEFQCPPHSWLDPRDTGISCMQNALKYSSIKAT